MLKISAFSKNEEFEIYIFNISSSAKFLSLKFTFPLKVKYMVIKDVKNKEKSKEETIYQ